MPKEYSVSRNTVYIYPITWPFHTYLDAEKALRLMQKDQHAYFDYADAVVIEREVSEWTESPTSTPKDSAPKDIRDKTHTNSESLEHYKKSFTNDPTPVERKDSWDF